MAHDASELLGAQQLAGTTVNPKGYGWKEGAARVGVVGPTIAYATARRSKEDISDTPAFPRIAFLAVTDQEVALLKIGSGGLNGKLEEVLARVPRSEVASAEVSGGALRCPVSINFTDDSSWQLEVSRLIRKQAQAVIHALGY